MGQLIAIVSQKGGVGKTSTAVNLGACISAIRKRVLLVGLDPQGGLEHCFGLDPSSTLVGLLDVLRDGVSPLDAIHATHPRLPRLDLLPGRVHNSEEESQYLGILTKNRRALVDVMGALREGYDFIFLDCPSRLDEPTLSALAAADSYLVPIQCEYASMGTVGRVLRTALEVKRRTNKTLNIFGFLLTMADKRAPFTPSVIQEVRQYLKGRIFKTIVPRDPTLAEVPQRRAPAIAFDIKSPGAKAYIMLAREILGGSSDT
ncbi:MAG: ParA family protein [Thermodesulfobacteriota bacterium]